MSARFVTCAMPVLMFAAFASAQPGERKITPDIDPPTAVSKPLVLDDGTTITQIDDVLGRMMDVELFAGPLSDEKRRSFMPDGKAPSSVSMYLVTIAGKTYLFDTGFGNAIKAQRVAPDKIAAVFITHEHGDHVSGLIGGDGKPIFRAPVFISKPEREYWNAPNTPNSDLQKKIAAAYGDNYKTFAFGATIIPGVKAINAVGHTPGHTAFLIGTGKKKLLIAGDFLHAAALQFPNPDESAKFDIDPKAAAAKRKELMAMAEKNNWLIAGMHIPMPGFGTVKSNGVGGFEFLSVD